MKKLLLFAAPLFLLFSSSCEEGKSAIKRLNRNDGTWTIETLRVDHYDAAGERIVSTDVSENAGELIFFRSATLNELFAHYMVTANLVDSIGTIRVYVGDVYFDHTRVAFAEDSSPNHSWPNELEGVWTVLEDKRNKQEWSLCAADLNGTLITKTTIFLKKK